MVASTRRLLVTGAAGFLGGVVVDSALSDPGTEMVAALDVRAVVPRPDLRFVGIHRDVREPLDDLLAGVDAVFHGAFLLKAQRDEQLARSVNVEATEMLLRACERAGIRRFVYPSSTTVYGARPGTGFHNETDEPRPLPGFRYAEYKVEVEDLIAAADLEAVVLRSCIVIGPGTANFITDSLRMRWLPLPAWADPPVQFLHRDDFGDVVRRVLGSDLQGVYNVAGAGTIPWREAVRLSGGHPIPVPMSILAGLTEVSWRFRLQSRSPAAGLGLIRHPWLASTDRIESELGWRPRFTSTEALRSWAVDR